MPGQITDFSPGAANMTPILSDFQPVSNLISNVTNSFNAVVTTSAPHGWSSGYTVQIIVPATYGMTLNEQTTIVVTGPTTFITQIDTTVVDTFVTPTFTAYTASGFTNAQAVWITGTALDNIA